jgi:hypothetical protein
MVSPADLDKLALETKTWRDRNFPGYLPGDQLLGVIEELGELSHAYLKGKQGIRGSLDEHDAAGRDAVGDCMIYLMGYMENHGFTPTHVLGRALNDRRVTSPDYAIFNLANRVGRIARWEVDSSSVKDWRELKGRVCGEILRALDMYCQHMGWDLVVCTQMAWDEVKERNWIDNPNTGVAE